MKKLILAGLLSVGVACANETEKCTSKACKDYLKQEKVFKNAYNTLLDEAQKLCEYANNLTIKEIKLVGFSDKAITDCEKKDFEKEKMK